MMNSETHRRRQEAAPTSGQRLNMLLRTTALALLGIGVIYLFQFLLVWLVRGAVVLPLLIAALVTLLGVAGILRRWPFAPGLGALVVLAPFVTALAIPLAGSTLLHPTANLAFFGILLVQFACALIALVGGATAVIQNAQGREQPSSRWLSPFLSGVLGLVLGMLLLAGIVSANPPSTAASTTTNGMPTVHIAGSTFLTNVVLVPKGGSAEVGPFTIAGVFHLYCTIHQGMSLTVVVQ
jgi:hypothetical protein